jgi:guanylate kinase
MDGRLRRALTATTRPPRPDEVDGKDYIFLSEEQFEQKRAAGELAESARVHGMWYGVPRESVTTALKKGKWVVLNVDVQGGLAIKKGYPDSVMIFLLPPSMEELEHRLRGRGTDNDEEIARRMRDALQEMAVAPKYEYVVVNDEVKACANRILAVVLAETSRTSRGLVVPGA